MRNHPSSSNTTSSSSYYSSDSTSLTPSNTSSSNYSSNSSSSIDSMTRCEGLDLLVKAVVHVSGSLLLVPFTQRRVIRRRKKALRFRTFEFVKELDEEEDDDDDEDEDFEVNLKKGKRKREKGLPLKYNDSVLQSWKKRSSRRARSTSKMNQSMG